jgi:hypothetical protein
VLPCFRQRAKITGKSTIFLIKTPLPRGRIPPRPAQKMRAPRPSLMAGSRRNPASAIVRYRPKSRGFQKYPPFSCRSVCGWGYKPPGSPSAFSCRLGYCSHGLYPTRELADAHFNLQGKAIQSINKTSGTRKITVDVPTVPRSLSL